MIRLTFETSGTTGEPKPIVHSLDAMTANAKAFNELAGLDASTVMYHCLPKTHMSGFLNTILCPTLAGGRVVFGPTFSAQTAGSFWTNLIDSGANAVWITPTIAATLLRLNRLDSDAAHSLAPSLRHVFCGTAPLPGKIREQWFGTFGVPLQESYGTSELMLVSVQSREQAYLDHNVGSLLPGVEASSADTGEILVSSPYSRHGYHTGDIGDYKDGRLTITGRIKDLIIRGGYNVSPARIEETVRKLPSVSDAVAIGQADEFWGEKIIVFAEGGDATSITAHCRECLPKSHWPDAIEIVDKLPRNEMGKVRKAALKSMIAA